MAFAQPSRGVADRERPALGCTPLTVVIAPAGFGKTTVMDGWSRRVPSSAYGTFDPFLGTNARDIGLVLVECARELGAAENLLIDAVGLLTPEGGGLGAEFVTRLGKALRGISEPYVCFLDDLHGLSEKASRDLGRLISAVADERRRFVVASRVELPWPVERWRITEFATVVSADQLRLSREEIAQLLPAESAQLAAAAHRATGGWPAAVEVIRWRLESSPAFDLDLETEVLDLVDYVLAEVLPALPEAEMRVLTRTSILQPFPTSVAVAVSGEATAAKVLFDAQRRTSLITALEDGRYSYHAVLRAALRRQLEHAEPELAQQLQLRAAGAWLDEADTFTTLTNAMDHLIAGRAWPEALQLLRRRLVQIDQNGRLDRFVEWLDAIPGQQWRDDIELVLQYGYANLRIGRFAQAIESLHDPVIGHNEHAAAVARLTYAWATGWTADPREALRLCEQTAPVLVALDKAAEQGGIPGFPGVHRFELATEIAAG